MGDMTGRRSGKMVSRVQVPGSKTGSGLPAVICERPKVRADVLYGQSAGEDARSPEELARDYKLPLEAVREAIDYSTHNLDLIRRKRKTELARRQEFYKKYPPLIPPDYRPS